MVKIKYDKFVKESTVSKKFKSGLYSLKRKIKFKIFLIFLIISKFQSQNIMEYNDSIVTIKISGSGPKKILSNEFNTQPDKVYIDDDLQNDFSYSYDLNENNVIKLVWNQPLRSCYQMFKNCDSIVEIKFINFDTSQCNNMASMFFCCTSLKSLDLSSFETSIVTKFSDMFKYCYNLISIDVSNFNTLKVLNMGHMFGYCHSLISLDLSSFSTFNTNYLDHMFRECKSIKTINFPNFDTTKANNMDEMFLDCSNLEYLNIKNYKTNNILNADFFNGSPENLIVTIEKKELISDKNKCITTKYINNINDFIKKINTEDNSCTEDCKLTNDHYEYNYKCYENCISGTYNNNYKCEDCHSDCKECEGPYTSDNSNCKTCKSNEKYLNYGNCISNCPRGSYINETTNQKICKCKFDQFFICSIESFNSDLDISCELNNDYYPIYNDLNKYTHFQKCAKKCDIQEIVNEYCILNYKGNENINKFDLLLNYVEKYFTSVDYNSTKIENLIDEFFEFHNLKVTLTTTKNQKNNEINNNETTIDLKECEITLKDIYNISYNETLFMKKIEVLEDGMMIPKIEFDVYYKLNLTNLVKLNLTYCINNKIDISIPIKLEGNIDIYNPNSGYYNDICYKATSDFGTDIILKDRKNEFIDYNKTVCQENCVFSEYDYNIPKVKCTCNIPKSSDKFDNIKIDKTKLLKDCIDIRNIANINLLACYKVLFSKKGIIKNYGSYSIMFIIIIRCIIIIIIYAKNLFNEITNKINEILYSLKNINLYQNQKIENKKEIKIKAKANIQKAKLKKLGHKKLKKSKPNNIINFKANPKEDSIYYLSANKINNKYDKKIEEKEKIFKNELNYIKNGFIIKKVKKILEYNDNELNNLTYDLALKIDKRN